MAQVHQVMQRGKVQYGLQRFVVDTPDDLLNLPAKTVPGSTAYVISTGAKYMHNNENVWVRIKTNNSSSGSGGGSSSGSTDGEWDGGSIDDEDTSGGAEGGEI